MSGLLTSLSDLQVPGTGPDTESVLNWGSDQTHEEKVGTVSKGWVTTPVATSGEERIRLCWYNDRKVMVWPGFPLDWGSLEALYLRLLHLGCSGSW